MIDIPKFTEKLEFEDINEVITKNYSLISKEYTTFLSEWLTNTNKIFKDSVKFYILIYIFNKNLEFYNNNLIEFDYETFNKTNQFDINKINIAEIAKNLNIPKETARRKILELENQGVIIRKKKNIIIDKNSFTLFDIIQTLNSLANLLVKIYNVCAREKVTTGNISKDEIFIKIKKRFSFVMFHYFEFIIPWTMRWKKFFDNDIELFIIWSVIVLNKTVKLVKVHNEKLNITSWRSEIEQMNTQGVNKMSLADITGIPRPTVSRKITKLFNRKLVQIDEYKLIHPQTTMYKRELYNIHNLSINSFSKFTVKVCNRIIFN
tara:strand:+ start:1365 stop:2324 length:960 start_codon:yes stop_codon:yes gene_type:complete